MAETAETNSSSLNKLLLILVCCFILLQFFATLRIALIGDDTEALHAAWLVKQGLEPYQDFFEHHHSFFYYFLSLFLSGSGETIWLARLVQLLIHFLNIFFLYKLAKIIGLVKKERLLYLFLVLGAQPFIWASIQIRPDSIMLLCSLMAVLLYFHSLKPNNPQQSSMFLLLSGICMGLSFLFLQKAIFLFVPLLMLVLYDVFLAKKDLKKGASTVCHFLLGFLLVISPYYLYLYSRNSLSTYWFFAYTTNQLWPIPGGGLTARFFSPLRSFFMRNPLLWLSIPLGFVYYFYLLFQKKNGAESAVSPRGKLFFLAVCQLLYILSLPLYFKRFLGAPYLIAFLPLSLVFAASFLNKQKDKVVLIFCILLSLIPAANHLKWIFYRAENNLIQEYVLANTSKQDKVWIFGFQYHPIFRYDVDYCWFEQEFCLELRGHERTTVDSYVAQTVSTKKPKMIYLETANYPQTHALLQETYNPTPYTYLWARGDN